MNRRNHLFTILATLCAIGLGCGFAWAASQSAVVAFNSGYVQNAFSFFDHMQNTAVVLSATVTSPSPSPAAPTVTNKTDSLTIAMAGDIMFDRDVRLLGQENGYDSLLAGVAPLFKSVDIAVANLEGPVTSSSSKTLLPGDKFVTNDLTFTFATSTPIALAHAGVGIVSLANNHTDNFGMSGFEQTEHWLDVNGVGHFGDPWNKGGTEKVICKNDTCVAFVGYHAFQPGFDTIVADVKRLTAAGDFVIVMPHWGVEYSATSTADQRAKARALIAAGAKAIIGSHPHVIEDHEWIGDVPVYYSLGNLLFDQYFSPQTMKGNIVELHIVKNESGTHLDHIDVFDTSTASKKGVTVSPTPVDDSHN